MDLDNIENIFLQGGSVKGTAYVGAFRELEKRGALKNIKRYAGTSAGSIGAALLAVGYSVDELELILRSVEYSTFLDGNNKRLLSRFTGAEKSFGGRIAGVFTAPAEGSSASSSLGKTFGLCKGEFFRIWIEKQITAKINNLSPTHPDIDTQIPKHLTFGELNALVSSEPEKYKHLHLIVANVSTGQAEFISSESEAHKNVIISDAVRCSMSIPILFDPAHLYVKTPSGVRQIGDSKMLYVDGGVTDNFRATLFDHARYIEGADPSIKHPIRNDRTLGLRLVTSEKVEYFQGRAEAPRKEFHGFIPFLMSIVSTMHRKQDVEFMLGNDIERTILIDTVGVGTLDFEMPEAKKDELIASGRKAVSDFFDQDKTSRSSEESGAAGPESGGEEEDDPDDNEAAASAALSGP